VRNSKLSILCGVSVAAVLSATSAWAASSPAAASADSGATVGEVIVTAQKREEKLQDVPVAVSVVGQQQLQQLHINEVGDLVHAVPALTVFGEPGNPETRFSIRGINTQSFSITSEQAVSFVLDGVVLGRAPTVGLFDVGQVEVLRGPQGTLFGKNASGGVISINTNAPVLGAYQAIAHAEFADRFDYRNLDGVVNLPLGDKAALRITAGENYDDGVVHNVVQDKDSVSRTDGTRARLLWEPTPDVTVNLIADYEKQQTSEQVYIQFAQFDNAAGQPIPIPGCGANTLITKNSNVSCNEDPTTNTSTDYGFSGQVDWRLGGHTLTSITSYRRYEQSGSIDVDGLPQFGFDNGNIFNNKVFTQELRVASPTGGWMDYVFGGYYSDTQVYNALSQAGGPASGLPAFLTPFGNPNTARSETWDYALFGQATFHPTDKLSLIVGGRETRDQIHFASQSFVTVGALLPTPLPLGPALDAQNQQTNFSWKLGVQYAFSRDLMAYATVTRGYKGPQIQFNAPALDLTTVTELVLGLPTPNASFSLIRPEIPTDYELGLKSSMFDGRLAVDGDIFYTRIDQFQTSAFNPNNGTVEATNIPYVTTAGVEIDVFGHPMHNLLLNGGLIYDEAEYGPAVTSCAPTEPGLCPASLLLNIKGNQLASAPKWKVTASGEYDHDFSGGLQGFGQADVVYTSQIDFAEYSDPLQNEAGHAVVGLRAGLRSPDRRWSVAVFVRNLFDDRQPAYLYAPFLLSGSTAPGVNTAGRSYSIDSYRLVGVSLDGKF
jgi:iron complex outermembrane receptor protein